MSVVTGEVLTAGAATATVGDGGADAATVLATTPNAVDAFLETGAKALLSPPNAAASSFALDVDEAEVVDAAGVEVVLVEVVF